MSSVGGAPGVKDPLSGHPGHLNPEQSHKLQKFKAELAAEGLYDEELFDDAYLLRFLRARKFDLPKAKLMWQDFIKWRTEFGVDNLYKSFEYPEAKEVDKIYPQFYHKTDKDGRPIYVEILGKIDLTKLFAVTTPERQLQRLVTEYEKFLRDRLPVCSEVKGQLIETSCTIMDLKDVGISQFWKVKGQVQAAAGISSNNYPETMGKFYIINAPWAFTSVWSLVKGWLDPVTQAKITILGHNYQSTLYEQIPKENLPKFLGGTCNCAEGCTLSNAGPWQDASLCEQARGRRSRGTGETYRKHEEDAARSAAAGQAATTTTAAPAARASLEQTGGTQASSAASTASAVTAAAPSSVAETASTAPTSRQGDDAAVSSLTAGTAGLSMAADGDVSSSKDEATAHDSASVHSSVNTQHKMVPLPADTEMTTVVSKVDA